MAARIIFAFLSQFARLVASVPVNPEIGIPNYVAGYPLCNVTGFTDVPGNYTQTTYKSSGVTLTECSEACRDDTVCKSFSYAAFYTGCWFFDQRVEKTQLLVDSESHFAHYDEACEIEDDQTDDDDKCDGWSNSNKRSNPFETDDEYDEEDDSDEDEDDEDEGIDDWLRRIWKEVFGKSH